jgi:hypothetical protein
LKNSIQATPVRMMVMRIIGFILQTSKTNERFLLGQKNYSFMASQAI